LNAAVGGLQGADVFARAPVLPVATAGELLRAVVDRDAEGEFAIDDRHSRSAGAVGRLGVQVGDERIGAPVGVRRAGDALVGVALAEVLAGGFVVGRVDALRVIAELRAG